VTCSCGCFEPATCQCRDERWAVYFSHLLRFHGEGTDAPWLVDDCATGTFSACVADAAEYPSAALAGAAASRVADGAGFRPSASAWIVRVR